MCGQNWKWVSTANGGQSDKGLDIEMDEEYNLYICGYYNYNAMFGNIDPPSDFGKEGFLAKIDTAGNWLWVRTAIGGWDERVLGICVDTVNHFIYATGTTWYYLNEFGNCGNYNYVGAADNIFIDKFDYNGNCIWHIIAGGDTDDHGYELITDQQGNIYLTGFISDEYNSGSMIAHFGNINTPVTGDDSVSFVAKMTPDGNFLWVQTFGGIDGERDNRIAIDKASNIYITGSFWGTKTFGNTTVTSNGNTDIFVVKYDSDGNFIWVKTTGSYLNDRGNAIMVSRDQDIYITGEFRDHVPFGADTLNNHGGPNGRDIFVARMTTDGEWVWAKRAGSKKGMERGNGICEDKWGNLYVTGQFRDTAKFSKYHILVSTDSVQVFVAAIDTNSKWLWAIQGGSPLIDRGTGIVADDSCHLYITGYYSQYATFGDYNTSWMGRKDVFVAKVSNDCIKTQPPPPPSDTDTSSVPLPTECFYEIPNVFSPNGDGMNDVFNISTNCLDQLSLTIYNRWGEIMGVFNTGNNWNGWDGLSDGKPASDGTYFYTGSITLTDGTTTELKGYFTLIR